MKRVRNLLLGMAWLLAAVVMGSSARCHGEVVDSAAVRASVAAMMEQYPDARLLDIYKSCFQNVYGPGHLTIDPVRAKAYIDEEIAQCKEPWDGPLYEPTVPDGRYIRLDLHAVADSTIPYATFLNAFMGSAMEPVTLPVEQWREQWHEMLEVITDMGLDSLPRFADDRDFIDDNLAQGRYEGHHSPEFEAIYRPHYRIIRRDLFTRRILPLLP